MRNISPPYPVSIVVIRSDLAGLSTEQARRALDGLPRCDYDVVIKPLRYRLAPHLAARCEFDDRRIVLQVPMPFRAFKEPVVYAARRKRGESMRFAWASETVWFRGRRDVLRFLYCHEWLHWYLHEVLEKGSSAETACDRFALRNFRRRLVTTDDADEALRRRPAKARVSS
jgi:predicted metal-dependent HD superfamily phosphohydrolase